MKKSKATWVVIVLLALLTGCGSFADSNVVISSHDKSVKVVAAFDPDRYGNPRYINPRLVVNQQEMTLPAMAGKHFVDWHVVFSEDDRYVAFAASVGLGDEIYIFDTNRGTLVKKVINPEALDALSFMNWSNDQLIFIQGSQIMVYDVSDDTLKDVVAEGDRWALFNPIPLAFNGSYYTFSWMWMGDAQNYVVVLMALHTDNWERWALTQETAPEDLRELVDVQPADHDAFLITYETREGKVKTVTMQFNPHG